MKKLVYVSIFALMLGACHKLVGGGWFYGLGGERVTFGFQAQCVEGVDFNDETWDTAWHEGQFQYNDRDNGVRFHGDIEIRLYSSVGGVRTCEDGPGISFPTNEAEISGTCRSQPGNFEGTFHARIEDHGIPGPGAGDFIMVDATCTLDGLPYHNQGYLGGGNISSLGHREKHK